MNLALDDRNYLGYVGAMQLRRAWGPSGTGYRSCIGDTVDNISIT